MHSEGVILLLLSSSFVDEKSFGKGFDRHGRLEDIVVTFLIRKLYRSFDFDPFLFFPLFEME